MGHGGNLIVQLTADHRGVEQLFEQVLAQPPGDPKRKEVADRITIELVRHAVAEELHLYPAVRTHLDGGDAVADEEIAHHMRVDRTLRRLERLDVPNTEFNRLMGQLMADVETHVTAQEQVLFPALTEACAPQELEELGEAIRRTKERAPTRPHLAAPYTPASRMFATGVGLVDRARDAVTGRGR